MIKANVKTEVSKNQYHILMGRAYGWIVAGRTEGEGSEKRYFIKVMLGSHRADIQEVLDTTI